MTRCELNDRSPICDIRIERQPHTPLSLVVIIELAAHIASCCVNPDNSFVEFHGASGRARAGFDFKEAKPRHLFVAFVKLPKPDTYFYRIVANVLGHSVNREGAWECSKRCQRSKIQS